MPRQKIRHGNDAIVSGHLDKIGRFSNRRRGFYQLTGSILAKSSKKKIDEVRWQLDVCDATVSENGRNGIAIVAGKKFLALYARDYEDWHRWFTALQLAALQKVENFYSVLCQVGEGGFASVYKARDIETGEVVALKSIDKSASARSFLSREVAILKDMDCPYVCSTYDIFETATKMHLVLEYMGGGSLYDLLEERGSLSEFETRKVMRQILAGVYYMHGRGAVHRDLKPENILIAKAGDLGDLRLGDCKNGFNSNYVLGRNNNVGLSRYQEESKLMYTMIGTPQFSAIEILRDEKYGPQVDLWSCGVIAYNLLTGQLPFSVNEVLQTFACGDVEVPYPSAWWASTSKEAIQFTKQLLCSDPQARVSAAGALCSPWLTQDSEHVWSHLLPKLETTRDDARISFGTGSVSREQKLIAAAISRTAKKRWRTSAISLCLLIRLGALDMTRSQMDPPLLAMSSISSDASCGDSDWDYSEANFDTPSEMSSFDSVVSDVSVSSPRAVSRAREDGVSTELAALKWQESVILSSEIDRTKSRRERAPLASNFARVSKTDGAGGRGFQRKRESIAMQPPPVTTEASSTRSVDFDVERQHSPSEASERQKRNWASSRILPGMRAILKHKMKL